MLQSVEISYLIQGTEDEERVKRAVESLVGRELPEERQEAEGHYGNAIILVRHHLTGAAAVDALRRILDRMEDKEKEAILRDLESGLDEHDALHLRLNKQVLVSSGTAVLAASDPIKIKVKPRSFLVRRDPFAFYARLVEGGS